MYVHVVMVMSKNGVHDVQDCIPIFSAGFHHKGLPQRIGMMLMCNHMHRISYWSVVATLFVAIAADPAEVVLNGRFETHDSSQCTWFELKLSLNKTAMGVACRCNKPLQGHQSYSCHYEAEAIERCSEYQNHPKGFFNGLIKQITGKFIKLHICMQEHTTLRDCRITYACMNIATTLRNCTCS